MFAKSKRLGQADVILSNSNFTARVFESYFPSIRQTLTTVYPGINIAAYETPVDASDPDIVAVTSYVGLMVNWSVPLTCTVMSRHYYPSTDLKRRKMQPLRSHPLPNLERECHNSPTCGLYSQVRLFQLPRRGVLNEYRWI